MNVKSTAGVAVLLVAVAAGAGFGGYTLGTKAGRESALAARSAFMRARGGDQDAGAPGGGQGQGGSGFGPGNMAFGEIKSVDGDTLQLSTAQEVLTVSMVLTTSSKRVGERSTRPLARSSTCASLGSPRARA